MDKAALITSVAGIIVSGVIGPQVTHWATRRSDRLRFEREDRAKRRDELRSVLDDAARLLAQGPTMLRKLLQSNPETAATDWAAELFPLRERLQLRLDPSSPVVMTYTDLTRTFAEVLERGDPIEDAVTTFNMLRTDFLAAGRDALKLPEHQGALP